jgi:ABC-type nitrate/sulfonate/bicarbonate transport system permease component
LVIGALLVLWWLLAPQLNPFVWPSPQLVLASLWELLRSGELLTHLAASLERVGLGFLAAVVLGTPLGLLLAISPRWRSALEPILQFLRPIPPIAWIPLTILWFGLGEGPAYSLTFIAAFFPIVMNTYLGVTGLDPQHLTVARVFGASRWQIFSEVIWPAALPTILTGYRIGLGIAWMAVMAAEMVAARSGLGFLIQNGQNLVRTDQVFVGMVSIGLAGWLLDRGFLFLQARWVRWA